MPGYNSNLLTGLATQLQTSGIGRFITGGVYDEGDTAITIGTQPAQPDRVITLMSYPVEDSDLGNVITGVQMKFRAGRDPRQVEDLSDSVYDLLHNKSGYRLGSIYVLLSWRQSATWFGQDTDQRVERVENYYLRAERPAPNSVD